VPSLHETLAPDSCPRRKRRFPCAYEDFFPTSATPLHHIPNPVTQQQRLQQTQAEQANNLAPSRSPSPPLNCFPVALLPLFSCIILWTAAWVFCVPLVVLLVTLLASFSCVTLWTAAWVFCVPLVVLLVTLLASFSCVALWTAAWVFCVPLVVWLVPVSFSCILLDSHVCIVPDQYIVII
jgi:hypothetical protein